MEMPFPLEMKGFHPVFFDKSIVEMEKPGWNKYSFHQIKINKSNWNDS